MMSKKRTTSKQGHNKLPISGNEVLRLMSDATAFSRVSRLALEEIEKLGANQVNYDKPIHGDHGWPAGIVWESLQTASHFNLAISLELTLKALLRLEKSREKRDTHKLGILHDRLTPSTRNRLEAAWSMVDKSMPMEVVAYLQAKTPQLHKLKHYTFNNLRDWFAYFDTDLQIYTKRYSWENIAEEKHRHYIKDLRLFYGLFEILCVLVLDKAKDVGILFSDKQKNELRRSPNFLTKSSISNLDSFYKKSGWNKDDHDRWTKQRLDGNHILVHRPDLFWEMLIMEGENYLTVEVGRAWSISKNLDDGTCTDPVLVAELTTNISK